MTSQTAEQKDFKEAEDLSHGDVWAANSPSQPYFIDIRINATCLYENEARALRDWLNKVLP